MRRHLATLLLCSVSLTLMAACNSADAVCPADPPQVRIAEESRLLGLGQSFVPTVNVLVCGGSQATDFVGFYRSSNTQVAAVDSLSGVVTASGSGSAYIFAQFQSPRSPVPGTYDSLLVTVP